MSTDGLDTKSLKVIASAEQIHKRIAELAKQISQDYRGKTLYAVAVLEDSFIFTADLVRALEVPVVCQFLKPEEHSAGEATEIRYSPEVNVQGQDVLILEGLVKSGITAEFLMRNMTGRGAKSVKLATFLDKQSERRISLQPDYFGFLVDESYVVGYGMGAPDLGRNLPYLASLPSPAGKGK
ncbi:MAG: hypoxanthine phosphoribosyltransferase [Acidobacteria bacterium]|nr:hypoxanthine phosphoribosyltransferase [Acidobacteriota bacterium]